MFCCLGVLCKFNKGVLEVPETRLLKVENAIFVIPNSLYLVAAHKIAHLIGLLISLAPSLGDITQLLTHHLHFYNRRGATKIMSSVLYFAEIVQFMHKTTSCRLSDHWLVTQVNISSTRSLASVQCTSIHSTFVRLYTK